jgi:hypothetical protein
VRKIYQILGPATTLDDILNNAECIAFSHRPADPAVHFTTVEIECDGKVMSVKGHELNRLYSFTDPADTELERVIVEHCAIPFPPDGEIYRKIHEIYDKVNYVPTAIVLDGKPIERRLPDRLTAFKPEDAFRSENLYVGGKLAAVAWTVDDQQSSREVGRLIEEDHHLGAPSLQLLKLNVPIGSKGLYADNVRAGILDWYIGEIHIVAPDVLPNAEGNGLRGGSARDAFVTELKAYYKRLEEAAERKSERLSLAKHFRKAREAAQRLTAGGLSPLQETQDMAKAGKAVEILETLSKRGPAANQQEKLRTDNAS